METGMERDGLEMALGKKNISYACFFQKESHR